MKISLAANQFLADDGIPLSAGRISVFLHDSDTPADLFYLVGSQYTQAPNPLICDEGGRIPTVFFDAAVVDVLVESSNGDGTYSQVDTYEDGFVLNPGVDGSTATGMAGLREVDTSVGTVEVVGYGSSTDCPPRHYVWDPSCTLPDDGGCIISSDVDPDGRWILLYDDMFLPSSFYGISQDDDSGISAFLTYPVKAGQWNIPLPPFPRFLRGTYGAQGIFTTDKTVAFDPGAKFTDAEIDCRSAIIFDHDSYVCDMKFSEDGVRANSSWFRTADCFLRCGASTLVLDPVNYYADDTLSSQVTLQGTAVEARGELQVTFVNSGRIVFDGCSMEGLEFLHVSDRLTFRNMDFTDSWFILPGTFDFYGNTLVRSAYGDTIRLDNFSDVGNYVRCIEADGKTEVDLSGRHADTISTSILRTFRNVSCDTLNVTAGIENVQFHRVDCQNVNVAAGNMSVYGSGIKFWTEPSVSVLYCRDSDVASQYAVTGTSMACTFENCHVGMSFSRATDNSARDAALTFRECTFYDNWAIGSKSISMYGCTVADGAIRVYPYHDGNDYRISAVFTGNIFAGTAPVEFTKMDDDACYDCIADWTIVDNSFTGNSDGIRCRYWSNRTGSNFDKAFIVPDSRSTIVYSGNSGNCPGDTMEGATLPPGESPWQTVDDGHGVDIRLYTRTMPRCCPVYGYLESSDTSRKLYDVSVPMADRETHVYVDGSDGYSYKQMAGLMYWQTARALPASDGDLFSMGLCIWATVPDSGDSYKVI